MQGWLFLAGAIVCEISGTTCMKLADSFSKLVPSILVFVFYAGTLVNMTFAMKHLEVGLVYAVWSGIGTAVVTIIGILLFNEAATAAKAVFTLLIIVGVVGLNLIAQPPSEKPKAVTSEVH